VNIPSDIVITIITALFGVLSAIFIFKTGKASGKKEEILAEEREKNEAAREVKEVKREVDAEVDTASDDHLAAIANRWLRASAPPDSKPN